MSKTWRGLGRSLVRRLNCRPSIGLAASTFCALLPFLSFGFTVDEIKDRVRGAYLYYWDSSYNQTWRNYNGHYDSVVSAFRSNWLAIETSSASLYVPDIDDIVYDRTNSYNSANSARPVYDSSDKYYSLTTFDDLRVIFKFAQSLYASGYRGTGFSDYYEISSSRARFNFNYLVACSDILSSTNTVFRQVLLNHLSSISASVQNIDVNVSGLQSTIQQGNDDIVDALIGDYPEIQEELKKGNSRAVDVRTSIKSQLQAWRNEAKQQLNDWKSDLKSDLQAWKTSDETGILNVRQHIQDVTSAVDSMKNQFATFDSQGSNVSFSAFTTNFVTVPITNVVTQSGNEISSNIQAAADMLDDRLYDIWDRFWNTAGAWDSDGINVRIVHPTDGDNHVLVKDDAVLRVLEDGVTFVSPELTQISDAWDSFLASYSPTNSLDWEPWFQKWVPFSEIVTNYYAEFNASAPASDIAQDFLERGFDPRRYSALPWFERVEVLLAMIADVRSNNVEVADIQGDMQQQVDNFQSLSTNVVLASSDVVGLFGYVQRFSTSLESIFGDRAAPLTGDYVLLSSGHWIGDQPLVLRINPTIQNLCRLIMQCIWYLGFLVLLWVVVNWCWQKVVAVLRWLWSMFDV